MKSYDEALEALGEALEEVSWQPEFPLGSTLESKQLDPKDRRRFIALLYLAAQRAKLYPVLCKDHAVREGVRVGGDIVAHVTAHLAGLSWIEAVLVAPLASAMCAMGLDDFCKQGPTHSQDESNSSGG